MRSSGVASAGCSRRSWTRTGRDRRRRVGRQGVADAEEAAACEAVGLQLIGCESDHTLDAVRNCLADLSFTVHGYTPGRFVLTQMAEFAFLGDSSEANSVAFQRIYAKYPAFAEEHKGIKEMQDRRVI